MATSTRIPVINAVDLFCGVGGLSFGLATAGVRVCAGVDIDANCEYAYEKNIKAPFLLRDIREVTGEEILALFPRRGLKLLAGCAPCQPFSTHMRGADTSGDVKWTLLDEFGRLVEEVNPELVTMENVTGIARTPVFKRFVAKLEELEYHVAFSSCYGPKFGLAQHRRRLVLLASRLGPVEKLEGTTKNFVPSVRQIIGQLPKLDAGSTDPKDPLHKARELTPLNLKRIKASKPGGTWRDWPESLRAECHRRESGASFQSVYARMEWDSPAPTITTQAFNFGTGRFGHPDQHRAITLREAAMLQGFPKRYSFVSKGAKVHFVSLGRLIGNAVPPPLGTAIGKKFTQHVKLTTALK
jgi:DNA (cytosine-5)-methyltransferase 1